jgi:hypothetical protein
MPSPYDDYNVLEAAARDYRDAGDYESALRIYFYMADGDDGLDGGYLGERIGDCYEKLGKIYAAIYWYGRAIEESGEHEPVAEARLAVLGTMSIDYIVKDFRRR